MPPKNKQQATVPDSTRKAQAKGQNKRKTVSKYVDLYDNVVHKGDEDPFGMDVACPKEAKKQKQLQAALAREGKALAKFS